MTYTKKQVKRFLRRHLKGRRDVKYGIVTLKRRGRKQYKSFLKKIRRGLFKYRFILIVYYRNHCTGVYINKKGIVNSRHHIPSQLRNDLKRTGVLFQTRSTRRPKKFIDSYMLYNLIKDVHGTNNAHNVHNALQTMNRYRRAPVHHHYYAQAGPSTMPASVQNGRRGKAVRFALQNILGSRHSNQSILDLRTRMGQLITQLNTTENSAVHQKLRSELGQLEEQMNMLEQRQGFDEQTENSEGVRGQFVPDAEFDADVENSESLQEQPVPDGRRRKRFHEFNARELEQHATDFKTDREQYRNRNRSNYNRGGSTGVHAGFSRRPQSTGIPPSFFVDQQGITESFATDLRFAGLQY